MNVLKDNRITIAAGIFWPEIGGPATYIKSIARSLEEQGTEVHVVCRSQFRKYDGDIELPFRVHRVKNSILKPLSYLNYFLTLLLTARKGNLIYAQGAISSGLPAILVNKILKKRFVVKIVGDYAWETAQNTGRTDLGIDEFQGSEKRGKVKLLYRIQSYVCRNSNIVIVPSNYLAGIVEKWGVPAEKIQVVYNGAEFAKADISQEEARKRIGVSGNILLSIGRLVPWKGFRMLIKIMPELLKINNFARLVIVGDGPQHGQLKSMIENAGLEKKVVLAGKKTKEELAVYMAAADMFVLNTSYEGFSHQILEALSAGIPVITTDVGGNREVMRAGENGYVVSHNDEFGLIEFVKSVWNAPESRLRFILEGQRTAKQFTTHKMVMETIKALSIL